MMILISRDTATQRTFADYCKIENLEFTIIENIEGLLQNKNIIRRSFIIIDWENVKYKEVLADLICHKCFLNVVTIGDNENGFKSVSDLNTALSIARYEIINNTVLSDYSEKDLENATAQVLEYYHFKLQYAGYKYLKRLCELQIIKANNSLNCNQLILELSQHFFVPNYKRILRDLRYLIQINNHKEIKSIRGEGEKVSVKAVVSFLIIKINEKLEDLNHFN